ncbi:hypothetical protein COU61_03690 [Candidatus Pacearchaeota archaeon CG10_big_fil_rev_8_21_14_0_10_35_13]|nr:MAG: hypothetical protein COU61_03690 [Candidatus Pacearchaeota archaeon CG10_big_fil_rev_8_21_14_0_10_35_13]
MSKRVSNKILIMFLISIASLTVVSAAITYQVPLGTDIGKQPGWNIHPDNTSMNNYCAARITNGEMKSYTLNSWGTSPTSKTYWSYDTSIGQWTAFPEIRNDYLGSVTCGRISGSIETINGKTNIYYENPKAKDLGLADNPIDQTTLSGDRYCVERGYMGMISMESGNVEGCNAEWKYAYDESLGTYKWNEVTGNCASIISIKCGVNYLEANGITGTAGTLGLPTTNNQYAGIYANDDNTKQYCTEKGGYLESYDKTIIDSSCSQNPDSAVIKEWNYNKETKNWEQKDYKINECNHATISKIICTNECSSTTQVMTRLSGKTNAHAEVVSSKKYPLEICYDELFGQKYTGSNPTTCQAGNRLMRLSGTTNAHAESPSVSNSLYQTDLCYGNLECRSATTCNGLGEVEVLRLSGETNAHVGIGGSNYGTKAICCKIPAKITGAHWEDLNGNTITTTGANATVTLVAAGADLQNQEITYKIEKKETVWVMFTTWKSTTTITNKGTGKWKPTNLGTYRFEATLQNGEKQTSGELTVTAENNKPAVITINAPIDGGIYFLDDKLLFNITVLDPDDEVAWYSWKFGDGIEEGLANGVTQKEESQGTIVGTGYLFSYSYAHNNGFRTNENGQRVQNIPNTGQKTIILTITDSRGVKYTKKADILIVNSMYAFAHIATPTYEQIITTKKVDFDATQKSYVVEAGHNPRSLNCLAGNCPTKSADGKITMTNTPAAITNINYTWLLSDGYKVSGYGTNYGNIKNYQYSTPGKKWAELKIGYNGNNASTYTNFTMSFDKPFCDISQDGTISNWIDNGISSNSFNSCYLADAQPTTCCPNNYLCDTGSNKCLPQTETDPKVCADYTTKLTCEAFTAQVANNSVNYECGVVFTDTDGKQKRADSCRCEWDTGTNICGSNYDLSIITSTGGGSVDIVFGGSCNTQTELVSDLCNKPEKIKIYKVISAIWNGNSNSPDKAECESQRNSEREIACIPFNQVRLPFWNYTSIIITIMIIIAGYLVRTKKE